MQNLYAPVCFVLGVALACAGCAGLSVPEAPATPTPDAPVWDATELREHLRFLNAAETAGRVTGSQRYARAAAYVAARMREFRLQPFLEDEFRVVYTTPVNYLQSASLLAAGPDSLRFFPGIDFLPDGRSDSGRVAVSTLLVEPEGTAERPALPPAAGVLMPEGAATTARLEQLAAAGAAAVLVVGRLHPALAPAPVRGLLVLQVTPQTAAQLMEVSAEELATLLTAPSASGPHDLRRRLHAAVTGQHQPGAGAINTMGYVAGKHPVESRDLVLVCADLDARGTIPGITTHDFENYGLGTAALLEVARNLSYVSRRWMMPGRTVLFAVWSGARTGHAGLRAYLQHPAWPLAQTRSVVYLGLRPEDEADVRAILDRHGIALHAVPPPAEPLHTTPFLLQPDPVLLQAARRAGRTSPEVLRIETTLILSRAVQQAHQIAEEAYPLVRALSLGPDEVQVTLGD